MHSLRVCRAACAKKSGLLHCPWMIAHPARQTARIATVRRQILLAQARFAPDFLTVRTFLGLPAHGVAGAGAAVGAGVMLGATRTGAVAGAATGALTADSEATGVRFVESIGFE